MKKQDPCLNDCLFRGNVYAGQGLKEISAILARVRLMPSILILDLEKAFLQLSLKESARDVTRMLWPLQPMTEDTPKTYRFTKVTFGIKSSPFLLGAVIEHHLRKYPTQLAKYLDNNSYVDNFIIPLTSGEKLLSAYKESRKIFFDSGFNARQYTSDLRKKLMQIPEEHRETRTQLSLLGVNWNTIQDTFQFDPPPAIDKITKRNVL